MCCNEGIKSAPKADLHVHLNGAIPTNVAKELLIPVKHSLPTWFDLESDLQVNEPVKCLAEYFKPWHGLKKLPYSRECLDIMIQSAIVAMKQDGIRYAEIRNSPFNISEINEISLEDSIGWLVESVKNRSVEADVDIRLILSLSRYGLTKDKIENMYNALGSFLGNDVIVGVDLSGDEDSGVPEEVEKFFTDVKNYFGLKVTIHAGEMGSIKNIEWALNACHADRIGHGLAASKSTKIMSQIKEKDVCLEICLYSNYLTGSIEDINLHPIKKFIEYGVPFVLCSDNPAVNGRTLADNYSIYNSVIISGVDCLEMYKRQLSYSFRRGR